MTRRRLSLGCRVELPAKIAERDRCMRAPPSPSLAPGASFRPTRLQRGPTLMHRLMLLGNWLAASLCLHCPLFDMRKPQSVNVQANA
jgi:hypothetical protein